MEIKGLAVKQTKQAEVAQTSFSEKPDKKWKEKSGGLVEHSTHNPSLSFKKKGLDQPQRNG